MNKANLPDDDSRTVHLAGLLRGAAGQMTEAYALLRQATATAESLRWDDAFSWHLEELQKAIDLCLQIEQRITAVASGDRL